MHKRVITLAITRDESEGAPSEFLIFRRGVNRTSKGEFLFDDEAARNVLKNAAKSNVDLMIDLDHLSLDDPKKMQRADGSDARGWFNVALRDGDLWAVNVRWTPDGARRLGEKTQRYISPAFLTEADGSRICELRNVALVAMPATFDAPALVAASKRVALGAKARAAAYKFLAKHSEI